MKNLLLNKKGITLLEGLIAMLLLAMVAVGTFGVLLSVSRQPAQPDIQEEMLYAVERANKLLQIYTYKLSGQQSGTNYPSSSSTMLTNLSKYFGSDPLSEGTHNGDSLHNLLPALCDWDKSDLTYTVTKTNFTASSALGVASDAYYYAAPAFGGGWEPSSLLYDVSNSNIPIYQVQFNITCNGYTL